LLTILPTQVQLLYFESLAQLDLVPLPVVRAIFFFANAGLSRFSFSFFFENAIVSSFFI